MDIAIVIGALGTDTKGLVQKQEDLKIRERMETSQTAALLRSARIIRRRLEEYSCHSDSSEKPSANDGVKISQMSTIFYQAILDALTHILVILETNFRLPLQYVW